MAQTGGRDPIYGLLAERPKLEILNISMDRWARHRVVPDSTAQGVDVARMDHNPHNDDDWWGPPPADRSPASDDALIATLVGLDPEFLPNDHPERARWMAMRDAILPALRPASFLLRAPDPAEEAALSQIPCAPQLFGTRALDWVAHPHLFEPRDRQADTLGAVVVATRWGDRPENGNGAISGAAYRLLHARFPDSDAVTRTKYWYN